MIRSASQHQAGLTIAPILPDFKPGTGMSAFGTYLIGFVILIAGLALAAHLLNVPGLWIVAGVIVMIGIGVLTATTRTKQRDPTVRRGPPGPPTV